MWFLHFIPDELIKLFLHFICLSGIALFVAGVFAKRLRIISLYGFIAKILGVLILLVGVYFEGGYGVEELWRARVADLQKQIAASEEKSKQENIVIETKYVTQVKLIHDKQYIIQEKIKEVATQIDAECKVDNAAVEILNQSAKVGDNLL
jgi:hypothetical protein